MPASKSRSLGRPHAPADLHGNTPDQREAALLLVDVINDLEFEGGDQGAKIRVKGLHFPEGGTQTVPVNVRF